MRKIIKLTAKKHSEIRKGSTPDVPVNEHVEIPPNHYGEFYIRKKYGKNGVEVPRSPFPEKWSGVPEITVMNNSANDLFLRAGDEIGELHIRYDPPSPFFGSAMAIAPPFVYCNKGDKIHVITNDHRYYECEELLLYTVNAHIRLDVENCPTTWNGIGREFDFMPNSIMQEYKQLPLPSMETMYNADVLSMFDRQAWEHLQANHVHVHPDTTSQESTSQAD